MVCPGKPCDVACGLLQLSAVRGLNESLQQRGSGCVRTGGALVGLVVHYNTVVWCRHCKAVEVDLMLLLVLQFKKK